jgi:hypothetical protein
MSVTVSSYDTAQISITRGSGGDRFEWLQGTGTGSVTLDLTRGNGGGTGYTFDLNSTYTAYRVFRITNNSGTSKTVRINHGSSDVTVVSGFINADAAPTGGTDFFLSNGGYVEVNLQIAAGTTGGTFTYSVIAD